MKMLSHHAAVFAIVVFFLAFISLFLCLVKTKREMRGLKRQLALERKRNQRFVEYERKLMRFRHDLRDRMLTIEYLLKEGKEQVGISKLIDIVGEFVSLDYEYAAGRYFWNAVIDTRLSQPKYQDLKVKRNTNIANLGRIEEIDLSMLLGNLLDNALAAASNSEEKRLDILLTEGKGCILLKVENSYREEGDGEKNKNSAAKSVQEELEHGFGLVRVREIVRKYHGKYDVKKENGTYTACVILPIS